MSEINTQQLTPHTWVAEGDDFMSWQPTKEVAERDLVGCLSGFGSATEVYPLYRLRWIPVSEMLPEPYVDVIAVAPGWNPSEMWIDAEEPRAWRAANDEVVDGVTHWMPMPVFPEPLTTVPEQT